MSSMRKGSRPNAAWLCMLMALLLVVLAPTALAQRKLTFGVNWWPEDATSRGFMPVVEAFKELHPDVEIEIMWVTALTQPWSPSTDRAITLWAAGMGPDVVLVATDVLGQHAFGGLLMPVDEYVAQSDVDPEDFVPGSWNEMFWDGSMYAMPLKVDPNFALVWNKDYAEQAGLPSDEGPATLSDFEDWFRRLTRVDATGQYTQLGAKPWDVYGNTNTMYTWGWTFGGEFYDPVEHRVTADHPANVQALTWVREYYQEYAPYAAQFEFPHKGEAMRFSVTETLTRWLDDFPDIPLGVGVQPFKEDGGPTNPSWVGGWAIGIMSGTDEPELAWKFVKFLSADPNGSAILSGPARWIPAYLKSDIIPVYLEDPYLDVYLRTAATAQFHRPVMPLSSDYGAALDRAFADVMNGVSQPRDALAFVTQLIQSELDLVMEAN